MPAFEFPFSIEDFVAKLLKDHPEMAPYRDVLTEYAGIYQERDEQLEGFLDQDTFAPAIGVEATTPVPVADASNQAIVFEAIAFQSTDLIVWDGATKLTIQESGICIVSSQAIYATNATGDVRYNAIIANALTELAGADPGPQPSPREPRVNTHAVVSLLAGDELELYAQQDSGGNLNLRVPRMQVTYLGKVN